MYEVVKLIQGLNLYDDFINTWKNRVQQTLKGYIPAVTIANDKKCSQYKVPEGLVFLRRMSCL